MVDIAGAIKKPFDDLKTAGIGIILGLIPLVNLLVVGYGVNVARRTVAKDNKLPAWSFDSLLQYLKDAIFAIIIYIIYMIPAGIAFAIGLGLAIGTLLPAILSGNTGAIVGGIAGAFAAGGVFALLAGLLVVIGEVMASIGIIFYAKENSLGAAFNFGAIIKKILTAQYIIAIIVLVVYWIVLGIIATVLSIIPVVGSLLGVGLAVYAATVTGMTLFAQVFNETP
ncbi:MAG: DUF4013 domain-containing protein [archaeon]|nr:DUF4013 domain-containing protein [archaeon]